MFEIQLRQKFWPEAYQTFRDYSLIVLALCEYQLVHWFWVFWSGKKRYETYCIFKFGKIRQFLWFSSFLKINLLYIFLHCDWTKQDWNTCEPILERRWTQVSPWIKKIADSSDCYRSKVLRSWSKAKFWWKIGHFRTFHIFSFLTKIVKTSEPIDIHTTPALSLNNPWESRKLCVKNCEAKTF